MEEIKYIEEQLESNEVVSDKCIELMLKNIGNIDQEIRDDLIYEGWWILSDKNKWTKAQRTWLLKKILDDNLLQIGINEESDLVFTRTFTSLLLCLLIKEDDYEPVSTNNELVDYIITSLNMETDTRGYTDDYKGWAHAFAHGSDLLTVLVNKFDLSDERINRILAFISDSLLKYDGFIHSEQNRMSAIVVACLNKGKNELVQKWFKEFIISKNNQNPRDVSMRTFCESLYFRMKFTTTDEIVEKDIIDYLSDYYHRFKVI